MANSVYGIWRHFRHHPYSFAARSGPIDSAAFEAAVAEAARINWDELAAPDYVQTTTPEIAFDSLFTFGELALSSPAAAHAAQTIPAPNGGEESVSSGEGVGGISADVPRSSSAHQLLIAAAKLVPADVIVASQRASGATLGGGGGVLVYQELADPRLPSFLLRATLTEPFADSHDCVWSPRNSHAYFNSAVIPPAVVGRLTTFPAAPFLPTVPSPYCPAAPAPAPASAPYPMGGGGYGAVPFVETVLLYLYALDDVPAAPLAAVLAATSAPLAALCAEFAAAAALACGSMGAIVQGDAPVLCYGGRAWAGRDLEQPISALHPRLGVLGVWAAAGRAAYWTTVRYAALPGPAVDPHGGSGSELPAPTGVVWVQGVGAKTPPCDGCGVVDSVHGVENAGATVGETSNERSPSVGHTRSRAVPGGYSREVNAVSSALTKYTKVSLTSTGPGDGGGGIWSSLSATPSGTAFVGGSAATGVTEQISAGCGSAAQNSLRKRVSDEKASIRADRSASCTALSTAILRSVTI